MNTDEYKDMILTPKNRRCYGEKIKSEKGNVKNSVNILNPDKCTTNLVYNEGVEMPRIIIDLGPSSPGGYPVFKVKSKKGVPILKIAYSDWYDCMTEIGDFTRGCCKYLGVELPVLPGNPNRFERYTINRTGIFSYPLIQGQQRFVMIWLETPGTEVEIEYFYIYYTSDMSEHIGFFKCSDDDLNRLWYASTYTCQIASIDNSQSWEAIEGKLALRALTKGNDAGVYRNGFEWENYSMEFDAQISYNPHCASGIGWILRSQNIDNGYVYFLNLDGTLHRYVRKNSINIEITPCIALDRTIVDNTNYHIKTQVRGNVLRTYIDGELVDTFMDNTYKTGTVGFCQTVEKWAFAENLIVSSDNGSILLNERFNAGLEDWEFTYSLPFVADGAKRDRLPWIGDLDWAGRNIYYAFNDEKKYMLNSLRLFARHQTPEGFIWGTCYPENTNEILKGDYGYYESDIFSAWFVPTLADYLLFTNDIDAIREMYQNVVKDLEYLWQFVEADGLFYQRYETSKGLWDHSLSDIGKYSYNNVIVQDAFSEGCFIAKSLGENEDADEFKRRADIMKKGIMKNLWDHKIGCLKKGLNNEGACVMANSLGLAIKLFSDDQALKVIDAMNIAHEKEPNMGKIVSLFIKGLYIYGAEENAINILRNPKGKFPNDSSVNWLAALKDDRGPCTTWECMIYPGSKQATGDSWGDLSHPDTAMAHILSGYILGIYPLEIGYKKYIVKPQISGLSNCEGIIPTPQGNIEFEWKIDDGKFYANLINPEGNIPQIFINKSYGSEVILTINGNTAKSIKSSATHYYF